MYNDIFKSACMYISVYLYIIICMYLYLYLCICVCVSVCICVSVSVCTCTCLSLYLYVIVYLYIRPMIATNIHARMGSSWHNLLYFPLFDRFIYYSLFSCVRINYFHFHCHCHCMYLYIYICLYVCISVLLLYNFCVVGDYCYNLKLFPSQQEVALDPEVDSSILRKYTREL